MDTQNNRSKWALKESLMSDFWESLTSMLKRKSPFSASGNCHGHVTLKATSYHHEGNSLRTSSIFWWWQNRLVKNTSVWRDLNYWINQPWNSYLKLLILGNNDSLRHLSQGFLLFAAERTLPNIQNIGEILNMKTLHIKIYRMPPKHYSEKVISFHLFHFQYTHSASNTWRIEIKKLEKRKAIQRQGRQEKMINSERNPVFSMSPTKHRIWAYNFLYIRTFPPSQLPYHPLSSASDSVSPFHSQGRGIHGIPLMSWPSREGEHLPGRCYTLFIKPAWPQKIRSWLWG